MMYKVYNVDVLLKKRGNMSNNDDLNLEDNKDYINQDNLIPAQPVANPNLTLLEQLKSELETLRVEREDLNRVFEQTRKGVDLLSNISTMAPVDMNYMKASINELESAGIDLVLVLEEKVISNASLIDSISVKYGVPSTLSEQFSHYDDRHIGAEAKKELLEDIETKLMSIIYNKINETRSKLEAVA